MRWHDVGRRIAQLGKSLRIPEMREPIPPGEYSPQSPTAAASSPETSVAGLDDPRFMQALSDTLRRDERVTAGCLHIIGIDRVQKHYGDRWPRVAPRIHGIIRDVIEAKLSDADFHCQMDNLSYLLVMPQASEDLARIKCALIVSEIARRVFGEQDAANLVHSATAVIGSKGEVDLQRHGVLQDLAALQRATTTTVGEEHALQDTAGDGDRDPASHATDEALRLSTDDLTREEDPGGSRTDNPDRWEKTHWNRKSEPLWLEEIKSVPDLPSDLTSVYRAIWCPGKRRITGSLSLPARLDRDGYLAIGGAAMPSRTASSDNADLDIFLLERLAESTTEGMESGSLVIPVHLATIATRHGRDDYLHVYWRSFAGGHRSCVFEVLGIVDSTPDSLIAEVTSALRPLAASVQVRVRLDDRNMDRYLPMNLNAIGADVANLSLSEADLLPLCRDFARRSATFGFDSFIHGLNSRSMSLAAASNGITYLDGDEVVSASKHLPAEMEFGIDDLYQPLLESLPD